MAMQKAQIGNALLLLLVVGLATGILFVPVLMEKPAGKATTASWYSTATTYPGSDCYMTLSNGARASMKCIGLPTGYYVAPRCGAEYVWTSFADDPGYFLRSAFIQDPNDPNKGWYSLGLIPGANGVETCGKEGCRHNRATVICTKNTPIDTGTLLCASAGKPGLKEPYSFFSQGIPQDPNYNPPSPPDFNIYSLGACNKCTESDDPEPTIPYNDGRICWGGSSYFFNKDPRISSDPLAALGGSYRHRWCSSGDCVWCGPDGTKQQSGGQPGTISGPQCSSNAQYGICTDESKAGRAIIKCNSGSGNTGGSTATGWDCMTIGPAPNYQLTPSASDWEYTPSDQTLSCVKCEKNVNTISATPVKVDSSGTEVPQGDSAGQYEKSTFYENSQWGNELLTDAYKEVPIHKNQRCKDSSAGQFFCTDDSVEHANPSRCVQNCENCRIIGTDITGKFYEGDCKEDNDGDNFVRASSNINDYTPDYPYPCLADCKNIDDTATCGPNPDCVDPANFLCSKCLKNPKKCFIVMSDLYYCKCSGQLPDGPDEGSDLDGYNGMYDTDGDKCKLYDLGEKITCRKDTNNNDLIQPYHENKIYIKNADYSGIVLEGALETLARDSSKKPKDCISKIKAKITYRDGSTATKESDNCCDPQPLAQTPTSSCQPNSPCRLEIEPGLLLPSGGSPALRVDVSTETSFSVWNSIDYKTYSTSKQQAIINIKPCPNGDVGTGPDFGLGASGANGVCVCDDEDGNSQPDGYLYPADAQNPDGKCVKFRMTGAEWWQTRNDGSEELNSRTTVFTPIVSGRERGEGFYRAKQDEPVYRINFVKENINLGSDLMIKAKISAADYNGADDPALAAPSVGCSPLNVNDCSIIMPNSNSVEYLRKVKYEFRGDFDSGLFIKLWNGENFVTRSKSISNLNPVYLIPLAKQMKVKIMGVPVDKLGNRGKAFPLESAKATLISSINIAQVNLAQEFNCVTKEDGECVFDMWAANPGQQPLQFMVQPVSRIFPPPATGALPPAPDNDPVTHKLAVYHEFLKISSTTIGGTVYLKQGTMTYSTTDETRAKILRYDIEEDISQKIIVDVIDCKELEEKIASKYSYPTTEFNKIYNPINRFRSVIGSRAMLSLCKVSLKVDNYAIGPLARTGAFWGVANTLLGMLSTVWSSITNFFSILWDKVTMVVKQATMGNSINQDTYAEATKWVNKHLRPDMYWVTKIDAKQRDGT